MRREGAKSEWWGKWVKVDVSTNETKGGGWEELFSDSRIRVHDK